VLLTTTFFSNIIQVSVLASAVIFALVVAHDLVGMVAVQSSDQNMKLKLKNAIIVLHLIKQRKVFSYLARRGG
jgi:hypothetical protein